MSSKPRTFDLHQLQPELLVNPTDDEPVRFIVVTSRGPRHVDIDTLRRLVDAPTPLTVSEVERIISSHTQAIAERIQPRVMEVPSTPQINPERLPVFMHVEGATVPAVPPEDGCTYEDLGAAQGDALGFLKAFTVQQGRYDAKSRYWNAPPDELDRPKPPKFGDPAEDFKAFQKLEADWIKRRNSELSFWRLQQAQVKPDGTKADTEPSYAINPTQLNDLARTFGLPVQKGDDVDVVPILMQAFQQLYKYLHSPAYKNQVVAHFHESLRDARKARVPSAPVSE